MRKAICEYIELSESDKRELWETATFVFDTNVLLNLYRYTIKTRDRLFQAIESLQDRIWMPYHVAREFIKDRYKVMSDSSKTYQELKKEADSFVQKCSSKLNLNKQKDSEMIELQKYINQWIETMEQKDPKNSDFFNDDILEKLLRIFDGKVGQGFDKEKINEIEEEGKKRYDNNTPPGFMDRDKQKNGSNNTYGDLIIWKEILRYALDEKKDIILITNDQKEDWWNIFEGKTIGPRVELRKEFYTVTNNRCFHMYKIDSFLSIYTDNKGEEIDESIMEEVGAVSNEPEFTLESDIDVWTDFDTLDALHERQLIEQLQVLKEKNDKRMRSIRRLQKRMRNHPGSPDDVQKEIFSTERNMRRAMEKIESIEKELYNIRKLRDGNKKTLALN